MRDAKERITRVYEQEAPIYDRAMCVGERTLLRRAREWVYQSAKA